MPLESPGENGSLIDGVLVFECDVKSVRFTPTSEQLLLPGNVVVAGQHNYLPSSRWYIDIHELYYTHTALGDAVTACNSGVGCWYLLATFCSGDVLLSAFLFPICAGSYLCRPRNRVDDFFFTFSRFLIVDDLFRT